MSVNATLTEAEYTINNGDTGWMLICTCLVFLMVNINKNFYTVF